MIFSRHFENYNWGTSDATESVGVEYTLRERCAGALMDLHKP